MALSQVLPRLKHTWAHKRRWDENGQTRGYEIGTAKQPGLETLTGAEGCQLLSHCILGYLPKLPTLKVKQLHFLDSLGFRLYQGEHKRK